MTVARGKKPRSIGRRPKSTNESTREAILDAAERLFAEHGFDGVTVRQVTHAAGVDVALAHYYFDTKRGLFDEVFRRRAKILNEARMASMDAYEARAGKRATVEGMVRAFLDPVFERWANADAGWKSYLALVAIVNNTPQWGGETMAHYFDPVIHRLIDGVRRALPDAHDEDLYWCYHFLSGALTLTLADTKRIDLLSEGLCHSSDVAAVTARMAPYAAAGIKAICQSGARARAAKPGVAVAKRRQPEPSRPSTR